jgi:hypothetical protein
MKQCKESTQAGKVKHASGQGKVLKQNKGGMQSGAGMKIDCIVMVVPGRKCVSLVEY